MGWVAGLPRVKALAFLVGMLAANSVQAADPLTIQLPWTVNTQFAGFLVAESKGFYTKAGLEVTINQGGPGINPIDILNRGGAHAALFQLHLALLARDSGVPIVNIAQFFTKGGLGLACRRDRGVAGPRDLKGKTIIYHTPGSDFQIRALAKRAGYTTSGAQPDVAPQQQRYGIDALVDGKIDCYSIMQYDEAWQIKNAGLPEAETTIIDYEAEAVGLMEDGFWVLERTLNEPGMVDRLARFVAASAEGWDYARKHPAEAVEIVMTHDLVGALKPQHETFSITGVGKLLPERADRLGYLDPAAFDAAVQLLLTGAEKPELKKAPTGAWTHRVWDALVALRNDLRLSRIQQGDPEHGTATNRDP
ncbi:MAG: NitT/TauT family transport system substrate-binding protein [Alphaproteobacteria bacterium]|jgi:NitT/TauT family transport system substrate-binding protein|nr:NitT/TauT family transport system substrate-binding protein [Alphaproteobacteria bacterium]